MSDPQQQSPVPPYASGAQPTAPQAYPGQPSYGAPQAAPAGYPVYQAPPGQQGSPAEYAGGAPYAGAAQAAPAPGYLAGPQGYPATAPSGPTNTPGRIGFIVGLLGLGISLLFDIVFRILIYTNPYHWISALSSIGAIIGFLFAAVALVLGIVGLRRRGAPLALAGIATGLGLAGVVGGLVNFLFSSFSAIFYSF